MNRYVKWFCVFLFVGVFLIGAFSFQSVRSLDETKIVFLNVGEGDAILLQSGSQQLLIDSGADGRVLLARLGRYIPFWDRRIEMILATHSDRDHIGGFRSLFRSYTVERVLVSGLHNDTDTEREFRDLASQEGSRVEKIRSGTRFSFSDGGVLTVLWPLPDTFFDADRSNEGGVVSRYSFGETDFLLTGDLPREESFLSDIPQVDVLKVAHHGSRYSTSDSFLDLVSPKEAVVSVGKNSYGHPSLDVLSRLTSRNIPLFRTDYEGDIVYVCRKKSCEREK